MMPSDAKEGVVGLPGHTLQEADAPLVSIIIPTYNYGRYLSKAVKSCLDQTYGNLEIIVVDDGSTDDTRVVVEGLDSRVAYVHQENQGVSAARNNGLRRAKGTFIAFLDADDYLLSDSVAARVEVLLKHPDVGIVFTDADSCDPSGTVHHKERRLKDRVSDRFYEDLLLRHLRFQTSAVMLRSPLAKRFSFPVRLSNGEDIVYFAKVFFAAKGYFLARAATVNLSHADSLRHDVDEASGRTWPSSPPSSTTPSMKALWSTCERTSWRAGTSSFSEGSTFRTNRQRRASTFSRRSRSSRPSR